jgi:hypothetical protein
LRENFDRFNFAIHKEKEMADFRRWILAFATLVLVLGFVAPANAQNGLNCTASAAVTPTLRHEGFTELTGDIVLSCVGVAGATPTPAGSPIPQANVSVSLSAPVTSRVLTGTTSPQAVTDALLLVDDPGPGQQNVCPSPLNGAGCVDTGTGGVGTFKTQTYNVFQGLGCVNSATINCAPASNSITFLGVPVDPPLTAARTYRITNVRVDATAVPSGLVGFPVYAFVSVSPSSAMQISNPQQVVGLSAFGLSTSTSGLNPNFFQCENSGLASVGSITFMENFATAFKVQGANTTTSTASYPQTTPGVVYNSESGLEIFLPYSNTWSGYADTPTELQATFSNVPVGATVQVDSYVTDSTGTTAVMVSPVQASVGSGQVVVLDNSAGSAPAGITVVWAILATNPNAIDTLTFNVSASFTGQPGSPTTITGPATVTGGFSPQEASYLPLTANQVIPEFSSTVESPTTSANLFSVSQCQTILLFPYVTDYTGFDTGIAISNTSLDPLPVGQTAIQQSGTCSVTFFGAPGIATTIATNGVYSSTSDTTLTNGVIAPGQTWAFSLAAQDTTFGASTFTGTTGYAIATCNFQYAHGYSFVSDYGIQHFAAAYLALIIPDSIRAAQPFTCSENGGNCIANTGEQLVH